MMRGDVIRGFGSVLFVATLTTLVGGAFAPTKLEAAPDPLKLSRKCRKAIGKSATKLAVTGLKQIDKCHKQRDKTQSDTDCNSLAGNTIFGRQGAVFEAKINAACKPDDPVEANYPDGDIPGSVVPSVTAAVEDSGSEVQGLPSFTGDPSQVKALSKCHGAIGQGRTKTVAFALKAITKCQQAADKSADTFPPLGACESAGDGAAAQGTSKVAKKCGGLELPVVTQGAIAGGIITTCTDPTACVSEEAIQTAHRIASSAYGGGCGNGIQEPGEECDDGNDDNDDGCSNQCTQPVCGDGVRQGDEECDDGNDVADDGCNNQCKLPVCGDGVREGDEECDDGNEIPDDGCTSCTVDPLGCSTDGTLRIRTSLEFNVATSLNAGAVMTRLSYPESLDLPSFALGNGVDFVCTPADGEAGCPDVRFFPISGAFFPQAFDCTADASDPTMCSPSGTRDDSLFTNFLETLPETIEEGDLYEVVFDCEAGTEIDPATVPCSVVDAKDAGGNPIDVASFHCSVEVVRPTASATRAPEAP
jgi:cysteine-rich repeat protein